MSAEKIYKSFVEKAKYYLTELDFYGKYQFSHHPIPDTWSMGQLYNHLIHGTKSFHLEEVKNCLEKRNGQEGGTKTWKGKIVFKFKRFPFKVIGLNHNYKPEKLDIRPDKMKDDMYKFFKVMNRTAVAIDEDGILTYKTKHPTFGMLNALEWFELIDIHFKHHMGLKKKLDPFVRSKSKELAIESDEH